MPRKAAKVQITQRQMEVLEEFAATRTAAVRLVQRFVSTHNKSVCGKSSESRLGTLDPHRVKLSGLAYSEPLTFSL